MMDEAKSQNTVESRAVGALACLGLSEI